MSGRSLAYETYHANYGYSDTGIAESYLERLSPFEPTPFEQIPPPDWSKPWQQRACLRHALNRRFDLLISL